MGHARGGAVTRQGKGPVSEALRLSEAVKEFVGRRPVHLEPEKGQRVSKLLFADRAAPVLVPLVEQVDHTHGIFREGVAQLLDERALALRRG